MDNGKSISGCVANFEYFLYLIHEVDTSEKFRDSLYKVPIEYNYAVPLQDVADFIKYKTSKLNKFKNAAFESNCLGRSRRISHKRWKLYQRFDPSRAYTIKMELPDSAELKKLIRDKKIVKYCPCELTKQGLISLVVGADCSHYSLRLVAWLEKNE
ncbi:MAG: hypothetical protein LC115_10680 [Bacteroidia bacterium]|nr:hypothetical protein [Bacteroidia bacterium]